MTPEAIKALVQREARRIAQDEIARAKARESRGGPIIPSFPCKDARS